MSTQSIAQRDRIDSILGVQRTDSRQRLWHECGLELEQVRAYGGTIRGYTLPGADARLTKCPDCRGALLVKAIVDRQPAWFSCANRSCRADLNTQRQEDDSKRNGYCPHCAGRCPACWAEVGPVTAAIARRVNACPQCSGSEEATP